jgi:hypothetical protein
MNLYHSTRNYIMHYITQLPSTGRSNKRGNEDTRRYGYWEEEQSLDDALY